MVLDPSPQSLPVHFFGSRPQPPTSPQVMMSHVMSASHPLERVCTTLSLWILCSKALQSCDPCDVSKGSVMKSVWHVKRISHVIRVTCHDFISRGTKVMLCHTVMSRHQVTSCHVIVSCHDTKVMLESSWKSINSRTSIQALWGGYG